MDSVEIRKKMFGKEIGFVIHNVDSTLAKELIEEVYSEGLRLQKIFNFYDEKSELSVLNKKRAAEVSKELLFVLTNALKIAERTEGKYDVSLGRQFLERKSGKKVSPVNCSYKDIKITGTKVELLNEEVLIDLGSIAKGYIADKLAEMLIGKGIVSGLIDARGDIVSFGEEEILDIQHPRDKDKVIGEIKVKNCGVATSGDYNQFNKSYDESHIINKQNYISVTVIAPTLMEADMYATAVFVTPRDKVGELLKSNENIRVLCLNKELKTERYNNFPGGSLE